MDIIPIAVEKITVNQTIVINDTVTRVKDIDKRKNVTLYYGFRSHSKITVPFGTLIDTL